MVGWIILLICIAATFVILRATLLPKLFLSSGYRKIPIDYLPETLIKNYLVNCGVSHSDDKNYFTCGYANDVKTIDYDIVTYDFTGGIYKVINVKENFEGSPAPREVALPKRAAQTRLFLNSVNGENVSNKRARAFSFSAMTGFFTCCAVLEFVLAFLTVLCVAHIFTGNNANSFFSLYAMMGVILWAVVFACDLAVTIPYIIFSKKPLTVTNAKPSYMGAANKTFKNSVVFWVFSAIALIVIIVFPFVEGDKYVNGGMYLESGGVKYSLSTENVNEAYVVDITVNGAVVIPKSVKGRRVTRILALKSDVREISILDDLTVLPGAFSGCRKLKTVIMNNVKYISERAFYLCKELLSVEARSALSIGNNAFYGCENLLRADLNAYTEIAVSAFARCEKVIINVW